MFGIKKSIDDDGVALGRIPLARARGFAINHIRSAVDGHTWSRMNNWEIVADNLSKAGWSWGCVSALNWDGRTIWIPDVHRDDGKRFVVRADKC